MLNTLQVLLGTTAHDVSMPPGINEMSRINTAQLRWLFLGPVMLIIFIMIATLIGAAYDHAQDEINQEMQRLKTSSNEIYQDNLEHLTGMLAGITETMAVNDVLRKALLKKDRAALSKFAAPIFTTLQDKHHITHLYVIGADRMVLLRAHNPAFFGDVINRFTLLDAQRKKSASHGVELGTLGILALRYVSPLYQDEAKQHLIGFVELGVDTNHLLKDVQRSLGIQMYEFLTKDMLNREMWRRELAEPTNSLEWDRFSDVVPSPEALRFLSPEMSAVISKGVYPSPENLLKFSLSEREFRALSFPTLDVQEHKAGSVVMLVDVTTNVEAARKTLYLGLTLGLAGCSLLFALFWLLTGRVGLLIEQHQDVLHRMATHDGLTNLYNHIAFYSMLENEVARSQRSNAPVSLLMLDIDHFKGVNDKFGHIAGDTILREFGKIIKQLSRSIDKVCRYGGEEIAVILPETNSAGAKIIGERMRTTIEGHLFKLDDGRVVSITVSIGVASISEHAVSAHQLVDVTDQALYKAKELGRNQVQLFNF